MAKAPGIGAEITKKAFEYIDAIAENLGVATEYVFTVLVRQQFAMGISGVVITLVLIVLGALGLKALHKKEREEWNDSDATFAVWVVTVIYFACVIGASFMLQNDIMRIVNPEYYAIKEILDALTGGSTE